MTDIKQPPDPETLRMLMRLMLKNFESAGRRNAGSMIGVPTREEAREDGQKDGQ